MVLATCIFGLLACQKNGGISTPAPGDEPRTSGKTQTMGKTTKVDQHDTVPLVDCGDTSTEEMIRHLRRTYPQTEIDAPLQYLPKHPIRPHQVTTPFFVRGQVYDFDEATPSGNFHSSTKSPS